jgi:CopG family nickel-responsive transcriptional regulator
MARPISTEPGVSRISVSLPASLLEDLDQLVAQRGYGSRSHAVADMANAHILESRRELGDDVMVGTVTVHYDRSVPGLQGRLADLQYEHIDEVISSLHVHLSENQVLEVILVQGRAAKLQGIANQMLTRRGVIGGRLQLHAAVIPPIQLPLKKARDHAR